MWYEDDDEKKIVDAGEHVAREHFAILELQDLAPRIVALEDQNRELQQSLQLLQAQKDAAPPVAATQHEYDNKDAAPLVDVMQQEYAPKDAAPLEVVLQQQFGEKDVFLSSC